MKFLNVYLAWFTSFHDFNERRQPKLQCASCIIIPTLHVRSFVQFHQHSSIKYNSTASFNRNISSVQNYWILFQFECVLLLWHFLLPSSMQITLHPNRRKKIEWFKPGELGPRMLAISFAQFQVYFVLEDKYLTPGAHMGSMVTWEPWTEWDKQLFVYWHGHCADTTTAYDFALPVNSAKLDF